MKEMSLICSFISKFNGHSAYVCLHAFYIHMQIQVTVEFKSFNQKN